MSSDLNLSCQFQLNNYAWRIATRVLHSFACIAAFKRLMAQLPAVDVSCAIKAHAKEPRSSVVKTNGEI